MEILIKGNYFENVQRKAKILIMKVDRKSMKSHELH